ncbi:MAG: hypothetical protein RLZZ299_2729 [Pseudomonadota bacterium]
MESAGAWREALETSSLAEVAAARGVDPAALTRALVEAGRGMAAQDAPWWPEARRMLACASIRAVARAFDTEPRRIRRALARLGLRVAGEDLDGQGVAVLARARLGRASDDSIAKELGVIPEAVAGERRRRGIPAFRPGRRVRRRTSDAPIDVVVRRHAASDGGSATPADPPASPGPSEPVSAPRVEAPSREVRVRRFLHARGQEEPSVLPGAEARQGRQRLVRPSAVPSAPEPAVVIPVPRRSGRRPGRADRWRPVDDAAAREGVEEAVEAAVPVVPAPAAAVAPPSPPVAVPETGASVPDTSVPAARWRVEFDDAPPLEFHAASLAAAVVLLARRVGPAAETARLSRLTG